MRTTVVSPSGRAEVSMCSDAGALLTISEAWPGGENVAIALDKHALYVLGNALIHMAQTIEADEGGTILNVRRKCVRVLSDGMVCGLDGVQCPDCGPCLVDYAEALE